MAKLMILELNFKPYFLLIHMNIFFDFLSYLMIALININIRVRLGMRI